MIRFHYLHAHSFWLQNHLEHEFKISHFFLILLEEVNSTAFTCVFKTLHLDVSSNTLPAFFLFFIYDVLICFLSSRLNAESVIVDIFLRRLIIIFKMQVIRCTTIIAITQKRVSIIMLTQFCIICQNNL